MKKQILILILGIGFIYASCKHKAINPSNTASPSQNTNTNQNGNNLCTVSSAVSYAQMIKPILSQNCYSCHDNTTAMPLTTYNNVKAYVVSGQLIGCLTGDPNYQAMPEGGTLDTCSLKQIKAWVAQGYPNN